MGAHSNAPSWVKWDRAAPVKTALQGPLLLTQPPPWIFSVHCCKNNLPRRGDVPSSVKCAFSDLFPNLKTQIEVYKASKSISCTSAFRCYSIDGVKACCLGLNLCSWDGPSQSWQMDMGTLVSQCATLAPFSPSEHCMFVTSPHSEVFTTLRARSSVRNTNRRKSQRKISESI